MTFPEHHLAEDPIPPVLLICRKHWKKSRMLLVEWFLLKSKVFFDTYLLVLSFVYFDMYDF